MNWEIGIDVYTLICIKEITNKNLLYKKIEIQKKKKKEMLSTKKVDIFIAEIYLCFYCRDYIAISIPHFTYDKKKTVNNQLFEGTAKSIWTTEEKET